MKRGIVGANLGFRQHSGLVNRAEKLDIIQGELARLAYACKFNGKNPEHQNGFGPGFEPAECGWVTLGEWNALRSARAQRGWHERFVRLLSIRAGEPVRAKPGKQCGGHGYKSPYHACNRETGHRGAHVHLDPLNRPVDAWTDEDLLSLM